MKVKDPFKIDKLRFLLAVYEKKGVAKAGEKFDLSPPAASRLLDELRGYFNDKLFISNRNRLVETNRFLELLPSIRSIVALSESLAEPSFDIADINTCFRFSCSPAFAANMVNWVLPKMMAQAPKSSLEHISLTDNPLQALMDGEIDVLFGRCIGLPASAHFHRISVGIRCLLLRKKHPLFELQKCRALTLDDLARYRRISLSSGRKHDWKGPDRGIFSSTEHRSQIAFKTDRPYLAWKSMCDSDLIMVCTRGSAEVALEMFPDLATMSLPEEVKEDQIPQMAIIWTDLTHRDPAHIWFRNLLFTWDSEWEKKFGGS